MKYILLTCLIAIIWSGANIKDVQADPVHPNCQNQTVELDEGCPANDNRGCLSKTILSTTLEDLRGVFVAMIDRLNIQIEGRYEPRPPPCKWPQNCGPRLPGFDSGCNGSPSNRPPTTPEPITTSITTVPSPGTAPVTTSPVTLPEP